MSRLSPTDHEVVSYHGFTRPGIRIWLPVTMALALILCASTIGQDVRLVEVVGLIALLYVAISTLVSVCEIAVLDDGLIIKRLLLPERFIPWDAIDRVLVLSNSRMARGAEIEIASIGIYEGLSPLNRLPGPVYGQGLRQTIIITPDTLENYDSLLSSLEAHCVVVRQQGRR